MEILPSITSQLLYGENGRAVLPLEIFINKGQTGGKKDKSVNEKKSHLGVPLVLVVLENPRSQSSVIDNYMQIPDSFDTDITNSSKDNKSMYDVNYLQEDTGLGPSNYNPITDDEYNNMFSKLLDGESEIEKEYNDENYTEKQRHPKKYTRKIRYE